MPTVVIKGVFYLVRHVKIQDIGSLWIQTADVVRRFLDSSRKNATMGNGVKKIVGTHIHAVYFVWHIIGHGVPLFTIHELLPKKVLYNLGGGFHTLAGKKAFELGLIIKDDQSLIDACALDIQISHRISHNLSRQELNRLVEIFRIRFG